MYVCVCVSVFLQHMSNKSTFTLFHTNADKVYNLEGKKFVSEVELTLCSALQIENKHLTYFTENVNVSSVFVFELIATSF